MLAFFKYNWQVRDDWFDWCKSLSEEDLMKERTGGVGSILYTLFHIVDVEYSWLRGIQGKEDIVMNFADFDTLNQVQTLSGQLRNEIKEFLLRTNWDEIKEKVVTVPWDTTSYTIEEIVHHIIAHEIHHIGQLSVWSRELGLSPVSANFIGREWGE